MRLTVEECVAVCDDPFQPGVLEQGVDCSCLAVRRQGGRGALLESQKIVGEMFRGVLLWSVST